MGAIDRIKREWHSDLQQARWAGFFAQAKVSEHGKILKKLTDDKPKSTVMTGTQIALSMRAWAARAKA